MLCFSSMPACARHLLRPELGNCLLGMVVVSAVPCLVLLCASPGTPPKLELLPRRSAPQTAVCTLRRSLPSYRGPRRVLRTGLARP